MYCNKCGFDVGSAKFCTECGAAALALPMAPPELYLPQPETGSAKKTKKITAKWWAIIGAVMFAFGVFRFAANIAGLTGDFEPSRNEFFYRQDYEAALQAYHIARVLAVMAVILYLAMMIAGVAIVLKNYKKAKEQK